MTALVTRYGAMLTGLMVALTAFWLLAMVILPNLILLEFSFRPYLPVDQMGGPKDVYTLANYATFFTSPIHLQIFGLTVLYSSIVTLICLVLAYPVAYFLAKVSPPSNAATWFLLLLIPLWVSEVLRSFAWSIILAYQGPLNALLHGLGLIDKGIRWRTGFNGVIIGLVYTYVLFMVFPIYNAIQSLDTQPDRGRAGPRRAALAHPLAGCDAARQARHRLGLHHGVHAVGRLHPGAEHPRLDHLALVHRDHPAMVLRVGRLEYRLGLRLPAARALHRLRQPDDAPAERAPHRHRQVRAGA